MRKEKVAVSNKLPATSYGETRARRNNVKSERLLPSASFQYTILFVPEKRGIF